MGKGERPELQNPPEIFYNEEEAHKYTHNSRIMAIQVCPAVPLPVHLCGCAWPTTAQSALLCLVIMQPACASVDRLLHDRSAWASSPPPPPRT